MKAFKTTSVAAFAGILLLCTVFQSCNDDAPNKKYPYSVKQKNGTGWSSEYTFLGCDSATMVTQKEAIAYIGGTKIRVFADQITISTNTYLK